MFSTAVDGQTNVEIHVLQGEREMSNDNKSLGTFRLDGIPPAPRGVPQIEVIFDIDANGILNVTAKDKGSGKEQSISITGASTLSDSEVDRMVQDAEVNASVDQERREGIEAKNQADSLVYQAEKQLNEFGDKVSESDRAEADRLVQELKDAIAADDTAKMKSITEELQQSIYKIGAEMYQGAGGPDDMGDPGDPGDPDMGADAADAGSSSADDDVIDAEFSESK